MQNKLINHCPRAQYHGVLEMSDLELGKNNTYTIKILSIYLSCFI